MRRGPPIALLVLLAFALGLVLGVLLQRSGAVGAVRQGLGLPPPPSSPWVGPGPGPGTPAPALTPTATVTLSPTPPPAQTAIATPGG